MLGSTAMQAATPKTALVMAWNIDAISTFDPAQSAKWSPNEILQNTCDSLVDFDPADERKIIPLLAESWTVSPDGRPSLQDPQGGQIPVEQYRHRPGCRAEHAARGQLGSATPPP